VIYQSIYNLDSKINLIHILTLLLTIEAILHRFESNKKNLFIEYLKIFNYCLFIL